jgi:multiple sugar transport system permease protein
MSSIPTIEKKLVSEIQPGQKEKRRWWQTVFPYLLVAPAFIFTIWILYPFIQAVLYSLQNYLLSEPFAIHFIGLTNYWNLVRDPDFWHTVWITVAYTIVAVGIELLLGLALAFLLQPQTRLNNVLTTLMMLPLMVAPILASLMWKLMTNPEFGLANYFLSFIGQRNFPWGSSPKTAFLTVVMVDVWVYTPFIGILLLAGLRSLPRAPFEAAQIDGVSPWFTFRRLTLPLLMPYIITAVLFRVLQALQTFDIIFAMTGGGPGNALLNFSVQAYNQAFVFLNLGVSSALLIILWLISYLISQRMVGYWNRGMVVR